MARTFEGLATMIADMVRRPAVKSSNNVALTRRMVEVAGLEDVLKRVRFVHIAGTKGKGTCAAFASGLFSAQGHRTGMFTSPHVVDVRERILIDGKKLPKETFARYFFELNDRLESMALNESAALRESSSRATFFRFSFLLSLHIFAEERVTHAVVEVGIGGRLDDTNVVSPAACVVTSLGMDHMDVLGDSIEQIAREKAGIIKQGTACYADPQPYFPSTRDVLKRQAAAVQAPLVFLDRGVMPNAWPSLGIEGQHVLINAQLALAACRYVLGQPLVSPLSPVEWRALETTRLIGRSHKVSLGTCTLFLDGAHTTESISAATRWFVDSSERAQGARRVLVYYSSRDPKTVLKGFIERARAFERVVFLPIKDVEVEPDFGWRHTEAWRAVYSEVPCVALPSKVTALEQLMEVCAVDPQDQRPVHVFVTGSFFLVGHVLRLVETATMTEVCP